MAGEYTLNWTSPRTMSIRIGGWPLYGMLVSWMPAAWRNISVFRCIELPLPGLPKFSLPGSRLASATSSLMSFAGSVTGTAINEGATTNAPTPVTSFSGSHSPLYMTALAVSADAAKTQV